MIRRAHNSILRPTSFGLVLALSMCGANGQSFEVAPGRSAPSEVALTLTFEGVTNLGGPATLVATGPPNTGGLFVTGIELRADERAMPRVEPFQVSRFQTDANGEYRLQVALPAPSVPLFVQALVFSPLVGGFVSSPTVQIGLPAHPIQAGDVLITEIHRDPSQVPDAFGEWFELRNTTIAPIDLEGWAIRDDGGDLHVIANGGQGVVILPGAHLVLGINADSGTNGDVDVDYEYSNVGFDELADELLIESSTGLLVDRVAWNMGGSWPAQLSGCSMTLDRTSYSSLANDLGSSWCNASTPIHVLDAGSDRGTPGAENAVCGCGVLQDVPDGNFLDENCDGIDGDMTRAIFVATSGSPVATGTVTDPFDSIQAAIVLALASPTKDHIYVSEGTYFEDVDLGDGISIWGGYSQANDWARGPSYITTIQSNVAGAEGIVGVRGTSLAQPIVLGDLVIETGDATGSGQHNYGIKMHLVSDLTLERVEVRAGAGAPGTNGADGAGPVSGSYNGGNGGDGGVALFGGYDGQHGGGSCGTGGAGGAITTNGGTGWNGCNGSNGSFGFPGTNLGSIVGGAWSVAGQGSNGAYGSPGAGGGGGGGGGGGAFLFQPGGKGGQGGRGGLRGMPGQSGTAAGSSLALFASSSTVLVRNSLLESGNGGVGGNGGAGFPGQNGLSGSNGQFGTGTAGMGGRGGNGGKGGDGGHAAGGGGGHSYVLLIGSSANVTIQSTTLIVGSAGAGGTSAGNAGHDGEELLIKQL